MNRREAFGVCTGALTTALLGRSAARLDAEPPRKTSLGIVTYCFNLRRRGQRQRDAQADLFEPLVFLEHCRRLGAGGVQVPLGIRDETYATMLRRQAEAADMFVEGDIAPPADASQLERFEAEVRTAVRAGARALRTVILPGRRYEYFESAAQYRELAGRARRSLELAEPVLARHRMPLAVENHKDARVPERLELLRGLSSEWVGACVDVGNSIALLEDPLEVIAAYAPWAKSVHLKDHAVNETADGFLLADQPLGAGFLELRRMIALLRQAKPDLRFSLEVITRDPLRVPCLTEKYWATFGDVPGQDLARTLRTVRRHHSGTLPSLAGLSLAEQISRETAQVQESLAYAREQLAL
jgi:sugar phosphate isomerase/epimerase